MPTGVTEQIGSNQVADADVASRVLIAQAWVGLPFLCRSCTDAQPRRSVFKCCQPSDPMPTIIKYNDLTESSTASLQYISRGYGSLCHDVNPSIGSLGICMRLSGASSSGYPRDIPQTTDSEGLSFN